MSFSASVSSPVSPDEAVAKLRDAAEAQPSDQKDCYDGCVDAVEALLAAFDVPQVTVSVYGHAQVAGVEGSPPTNLTIAVQDHPVG